MSASHAPIPPAHPGGGGVLTASAGGCGAEGDDDDNDDDDPSHHKRLKPIHTAEADPVFPEDDDDDKEDAPAPVKDPPTTPPPRRPVGRQGRATDVAPHQCLKCNRTFSSPKSLYGHMRVHPRRKWPGTIPPSMLWEIEHEVANSLLLLSGAVEARQGKKYICDGCKQGFDSRQALGGHRASHKNRKGCYAKAKEAQRWGRRGGAKRREEVKGSSGAEPSGTKEEEGGEAAVAEGTSTRGRCEHGLDLNEPPVSSSSDTDSGNG